MKKPKWPKYEWRVLNTVSDRLFFERFLTKQDAMRFINELNDGDCDEVAIRVEILPTKRKARGG